MNENRLMNSSLRIAVAELSLQKREQTIRVLEITIFKRVLY